MITLEYMDQEASRAKRARIVNPLWEEVEKRIRMLDADCNSDLNLIDDEKGELTLGGGLGRYVVSVLREDGTNGTLLSPENTSPNETDELVVGGQISILEKKYLVALDLTLSVAHAFVERRSIEGFLWE